MNRKITYTLIIVMFLTVFIGHQNSILAQSTSDLEKEINKLEQEQNELKDKKDDIAGEKGITEHKMNDNVSEQTKVEQEINVIDNNLTATRNSIEEVETNIAKTNKEITRLNDNILELGKEINGLQERIKRRDLLLKDRLQAIQKNGGLMKYLDVILGSQNFGDFISRSSAVNTIMDQDKTIMEEQETDKLALEDRKIEVEAKKVEVETKKVALEEQKDEFIALEITLDAQVAERESLMAQLVEEYEELEEYNLNLEEEQQILKAQESTIKKAKQLAEIEKEELAQQALKKQEEERKAAKKNQGSGATSSGSQTPQISGGNGIFIRPAAGGSGPRSGFGWRTHPMYGTQKFHNGLDIQSPHGASVIAAGTGVVATAGWMGGYGNTITLTHQINGTTYTTLYAHLSQILVSSGQVVKQGDLIGRVGTTGNSTGPHLHFEVHPGGYKNPDNPLRYFH